MKRLLIVAALATATASPALAQERFLTVNPSLENSAIVVHNGQIVGTDPDIAVRMDLRRQAEYYLGRSGG